MKKKYAIISADFIASRKIKPAIRAALYSEIDNRLGNEAKTWIKNYARFRGDSIQCRATSVALSLRAALIVRCSDMAYIPAKINLPAKGYSNTQFDIRLAIGIGAADFINRKQISRSDGEAFVLSGTALDNLKTANERMTVKTGNAAQDEELEPIILLADALIQKWTQNQAAFVLHKLQGKKDDEIAQEFGITISAITQRKKNAQWYALEKAIEYFEAKFTA